MTTFLVKLLSANVIGILVGMITGTVINLFTSDDGIFKYYLAGISFLASAIALLFLLELRGKIDGKLRSTSDAIEKSQSNVDEPGTKLDEIIAAVRMTDEESIAWTVNVFNSAWGRNFLTLSLFSGVLVIAGIALTVYANRGSSNIENKLDAITKKLEEPPFCKK